MFVGLSLSLSFFVFPHSFFLGNGPKEQEGRKEVRLGKRPLKIYLLTLLVVGGGGGRTKPEIFYEDKPMFAEMVA